MTDTRSTPAASADPDLSGTVAVVTGGSRGIGAATAAALATHGAAVAVVGRDRAAIEFTVAAITATGGRAIGVPADCTNQDNLQALHRTVSDQLGAIDFLAAFAGGNGAPVATAQVSAAHWRTVLEGDLTATFLTVSAFLPTMITARHGVIITMSSAAARQPAQSSAAYAAAKAGVIAFSRHLASEVAEQSIRVHCLAPAAVENDTMRQHLPADRRAALDASFPPRPDRATRRHRRRRTIPRLAGVVLDHRDHPRRGRRQDHDLNTTRPATTSHPGTDTGDRPPL